MPTFMAPIFSGRKMGVTLCAISGRYSAEMGREGKEVGGECSDPGSGLGGTAHFCGDCWAGTGAWAKWPLLLQPTAWGLWPT